MEGITRRSMVAGSLAALAALALPNIGKADETQQPAAESTGITLDATTTKDWLTMGYPSSWTYEDYDSAFSVYEDGSTTTVIVMANTLDSPYDEEGVYTPEIAQTMLDASVNGSLQTLVGDYTRCYFDFHSGAGRVDGKAFYVSENTSTPLVGLIYVDIVGTMSCTMLVITGASFDLAGRKGIIDAMWDSRSYGQQQAAEQPQEQQQPEMTMGQQNALQKAHDYLDYTAFSYTGLIGQLEYEGFSTEDATFAADNCGADWNEQAALKAQDYLDYSAFSREGLIDQLMYEGFTAEQAEYGVSAVGY